MADYITDTLKNQLGVDDNDVLLAGMWIVFFYFFYSFHHTMLTCHRLSLLVTQKHSAGRQIIYYQQGSMLSSVSPHQAEIRHHVG
jgi:hypothetical protein